MWLLEDKPFDPAQFKLYANKLVEVMEEQSTPSIGNLTITPVRSSTAPLEMITWSPSLNLNGLITRGSSGSTVGSGACVCKQ